jgi:hypothetical protein
MISPKTLQLQLTWRFASFGVPSALTCVQTARSVLTGCRLPKVRSATEIGSLEAHESLRDEILSLFWDCEWNSCDKFRAVDHDTSGVVLIVTKNIRKTLFGGHTLASWNAFLTDLCCRWDGAFRNWTFISSFCASCRRTVVRGYSARWQEMRSVSTHSALSSRKPPGTKNFWKNFVTSVLQKMLLSQS